jgi:hypothetical protein
MYSIEMMSMPITLFVAETTIVALLYCCFGRRAPEYSGIRYR